MKILIYFNKKRLKSVGAVLVGIAIITVAAVSSKSIVQEATDPKIQNSQETMKTKAITDWGLSFQKNGEVPIGNVSAEDLSKYNAYYFQPTKEKILYLTFDVGYENGYTSKILDVLKKKEVKAAFFCTGAFAKDNAKLMKRMDQEGHIVGNHTTNHPDMSKIIKLEDFKKELAGVEDYYSKAVGCDMPKYYRPPQGKFCESNLKQANDMGYKTVFWSLAYVDWYDNKQPSKKEAFEKLIPRTHPGAIVLLHATSKTNSEILGELIDKWRDMGYTFCTLEDLK